MRQLRLGHTAQGYGWPVHIFFPNMNYCHGSHDTLHLTDAQQQTWVNAILLPSLRNSCPEDVVHHHSWLFEEARLKARSRSESAR